ncbi:MAG TPA: ABC transporter permease [Gemmatimonadales bacterium]|nr:ABC transporter permease [Gemmatimonadales bacterium]
MLNDLRYALRSLRKRPGFSAVVAITVALGIAATSTIFSVVNAVLLRPLPVANPGRLVSLLEVQERGGTNAVLSLPEYLAYREQSTVFSGLAAHHLSDITLNAGEGAVAGLALDVSGNYWDVLGIRPAVGRFFGTTEAEGPAAAEVAVVSHEFWISGLGGDDSVVGRTLHVNGRPLTVIGVAPRGFHGTMLGARPVTWLPMGLNDRLHPDRDLYAWARSNWLQPFGRLAPGAGLEQAQVQLSALARRFGETHDYAEGEVPIGARVLRFSGLPASSQRAVTRFMALLLVTAFLVLLIAAVNVAGMLLARAAQRRREVAIRLALGAGRRRLVRQLLTESLVLSLLGGGGGILLAAWGAGWLSRVRPPFAGAFQVDFSADGRVLAFAVLTSVLTGMVFGLAPALHASGADTARALKDALGRPRRAWGRATLVVAQLALSLLLLVSAGLLGRTLQSALQTQHGFEPKGVLAMELNLRLNRYDEERGRRFYADLLDRVRSLPGVDGAALATVVPLGTGWDQTRIRVPGFEAPAAGGFVLGYNVVSPGYFETLRMPLLAGRALTPADAESLRPVMVINQTFARRFWPGESAVGKLVESGGISIEIVGVVPDGKYRSFGEVPPLYAYRAFGRTYSPDVWLHVRARGDQAALTTAVRREIQALDPNVAPVALMTVEDVLASSLFAQRVAAAMIGVFGVVGLALAGVGLFGLLSFAVSQRTREIGLRMALGARRGEVIGLVLQQGMLLTALGIGLGLATAAASTRLIAGLLYGVTPTDPLTFGVAIVVLGGTALLAAFVPASRAARVDPMVALRTEQ